MDRNLLAELLKTEGIQFIPVDATKKPIPSGWQNTSRTYDYTDAQNVGMVCGKMSGNIEVVDIDCHHDKTGQILSDYKELILERDAALLKKLVIQKTRSAGYHLIYRCATIQGNTKLANDKKDGNTIPSLIETRGEGGQILVAPSVGYAIVQGSLSAIPEITIKERDILFSCARMLNRHIEAFSPSQRKIREMQAAVQDEKPWDAYNERGDWRALLEKHGWKFVRSRKGKHYFLRPGESSAEYSGDFNEDLGMFAVFSTSTVFEPQKGYTPFGMYAFLECNKDFSEAAKRLLKEGYGKYTPSKPVDKQSYVFSENRPPIPIEKTQEILADWDEIDAYLESVANGTLEMGLKTGLPDLDDYFLLKKNYFVIINGFDNVGKSNFMWYVGFLSALFHGWKWAFLCMENQSGPVVKKLIEFYWSKHYNSQTPAERQVARKFVQEHFHFLTIKRGWTYIEVLEGFAALKQTHGINAGLIDPYRSLVYDAKNEYAFHSKAGNDFKRFAQQEKISLYVNIHATGSSAKNYNKETNSQKPPTKADVEYGGAWTGPVDDFLTVHRLLGHPELKNQTQVFVRKIKEKEPGGDWTSDDKPVILKMPGGVHFTGADGFDPVKAWHENGYRPGKYTYEAPPQKPKYEPKPVAQSIASFETAAPTIIPRNFYEPAKAEEIIFGEVDGGEPF
jgi:putative DNA primase/helicase